MPAKKTRTEPAERAGDKARKALPPIDPTRPVHVVVWCTSKTRNMRLFQGPDSAAEARAEASRIAGRTGNVAMVFGPQRCAMKRPAVVAADEIQLSFLESGENA